MELEFIVTKDSIVKDYIKECGVSRTLGKKIKLYGKIYINNVEAKNHYPVKTNDVIRIQLDANINENIKQVNISIDILYEDEWMLIVNKEHDLAIQPSSKHQDDNLVARVLSYFEANNIKANCHILTRLDFATSGIVIIAKNAYTHNLLSQCDILKKYLAKVMGKMEDMEGKICLPIARDLSSKIKRKVDVYGKTAITIYKLIKVEDNTSTYELTLITGRTHQIRVHLSHLGFPIIGDKLYYGERSHRLHLHSYFVKFTHPIKGEVIKIEKYPTW